MRKPSSSDRLAQHPLQDSLPSKQSLKRHSSWDLDNMQVSSQHYASSGLMQCENVCTCLVPGLGVYCRVSLKPYHGPYFLSALIWQGFYQ